jgi:hypothetical protein
MFNITTTNFRIWPFGAASSVKATPPSYNDALLTGGCTSSSSGSFSAFADISFFAQLSDKQRAPQDRLKAMFTATEAVFWLVSQHPRIDNSPAGRDVYCILGSLAKECYSFMKISADDELARGEWNYKLHESFRRWQMFLYRFLSFCHSIDKTLQPLRKIQCCTTMVYNTLKSLHKDGLAEMELVLDRAHTLVLYGDKEARAGFPVPENIACSVHEGARRRRVRQLLNSAGFEAPEWEALVVLNHTSSQESCLECSERMR